MDDLRFLEKMNKSNERGRWIICALLFAATLLNYLDRQTLAVAAPLIQKELKLNNAQLGLLLSAFFYAYGGMQLVIGLILDRINIRWGYALAVIWWSFAGALTGTAHKFWNLFACRLLLGIGEAANWPAAMLIISRMMPPQERSLANGFFTGGSSIGALITPTLMIWLSLNFGWRAGFLTIGLLGVIWALGWLIVFPDKRKTDKASYQTEDREVVIEPQPINTHSGEPLSDLTGILKARSFWGLLIASAFANPCLYFYSTWFPTYLVQERGFSFNLSLGGTLVVPFLGLDVGYFVGGAAVVYLCKRGINVESSRKVVMIVAMFMMLLAIVIPWAESVSGAMIFIFISTMSLAGWQANYLSFVEEISRRHVATVSGILGGVGAFSGALFIWLTGEVSQDAHSFVPIFIALGIMPTIATLGALVATSRSSGSKLLHQLDHF